MQQSPSVVEHRRQVRERSHMIDHYEEISRIVSQTRRCFGTSETQFYVPMGRYRKSGVARFRDRPRGPTNRSKATARR